VGKLEDNRLRLLAAYLGNDQYVPDHMDTKLLVGRFCRAMNDECLEKDVVTPLHFTNANHNLSEGVGDADTFVEKVGEFLEVVKKIEAGDDMALYKINKVGSGQEEDLGKDRIENCSKRLQSVRTEDLEWKDCGVLDTCKNAS